MDIEIEAMAGTLESSDLLVKVSPHEEHKLELVITSEVMRQFGAQIRRVALETMRQLGLETGLVVIEDKGALDCAIRARIQAAVLRGARRTELDWSRLS